MELLVRLIENSKLSIGFARASGLGVIFLTVLVLAVSTD